MAKLISFALLKRPYLGAFFFTAFSATNAAVYQGLDANGNPVFSDQSSSGVEIIIPSPNSMEAIPESELTPTPSLFPKVNEAKNSYEQFRIIFPVENQVIRNNEGILKIALFISPELKKSHVIQIQLDDEILSMNWKQTTFHISDVHRGTHSIIARIVDSSSGNIIKALPKLIFHFKHSSKNF